MSCTSAIVSDKGIKKETNQDSVCIKEAVYKKKNIVMAVVCDGMGGLEKGELASATVIRAFMEWFDNKLPLEVEDFSMREVLDDWDSLIKRQNYQIAQYGKRNDITLGTTVSALFIMDDQYLIIHVGDSRIYKVTDKLEQITKDHSYVAQEVELGNMTEEEAQKSPKRNALLQCIGASATIEPQIEVGYIDDKDIFILCSDGFVHELSKDEIFDALSLDEVKTDKYLEKQCRYLVDLVMSRQEKDNITVAVLKYKRDKKASETKKKDIKKPVFNESEKTAELFGEPTAKLKCDKKDKKVAKIKEKKTDIRIHTEEYI